MGYSLVMAAAIFALTLCHSTCAFAQETELIDRAQRAPASSLDSTLQAVPFARWLAALRKVPLSEIRWEVNDCGEGGDGLSAPICVEAILDLGPDTTAHATLGVANREGKAVKPDVWMLYVIAKGSFIDFKRLPEWAAYIQSHTRSR
jgi:hypothetical protein